MPRTSWDRRPRGGFQWVFVPNTWDHTFMQYVVVDPNSIVDRTMWCGERGRYITQAESRWWAEIATKIHAARDRGVYTRWEYDPTYEPVDRPKLVITSWGNPYGGGDFR